MEEKERGVASSVGLCWVACGGEDEEKLKTTGRFGVVCCGGGERRVEEEEDEGDVMGGGK